MMILKGYGLSLNYPVPEHRPCGDIDIWLYGNQRQADELLRSTYGTKIDEDKHHHTVFHIDGVMTRIGRGETVCIRKGMKHAVRAISDLRFIEVQSGDLLIEEDIERFEWVW